MKSLQKQVLLICMAFLLTIILIPNVVLASGKNTNDNEDPMEDLYNGSCGTDVKWHYDMNGTLTISGTGPMDNYIEDYLLGEESSLNDYMGYWVPWLGLDVKRVIVEDGVTSIGNGAFYNSRVSEVSLPDTVTSIGTAAFYGSSLQKVTLPKSLAYISRCGFGCTGLQEVILPDTLTSIGRQAFTSCGRLKKVTLSKNLKWIERQAFEYCPIDTLELPDGLEVIEEFAISANKVIVPESVSRIDDYGIMAGEIDGKSGTEAERYAREFNINFVTNEKFKVVFKDEDGTILSEQTVPYGAAAKEPEEPKKASDNYYTYEFDRWDEWFYEITSDLVVTARYYARPRYYNVTYDTNGGTSTDRLSVSETYGTKLGKLPKTTRAGYEFRGWYTDPKQGEEVTDATEVKGDMVIYAHWHSLKPEKVKVTLKFKLGKLQPQISFNTYIGDVSKYEIQYSDSENFDSANTAIWQVKDAYRLSDMLKGMLKGKTYYIRARAVSNVKDSTGQYVYGDWSDAIKL